MKVLFIETKKKNLFLNENIKGFVSSLDKISILYSVQYKFPAVEIKNFAEEKGKKVVFFSQILGCSNPKLPKSKIILVGSGKFHALQLARKTKMPIYIIDNNKIEKISKEDIEKLRKKERAKLAKFYCSDNIGIFMSTKPGQYNLEKAIRIKKHLGKKFKNKKFLIFLFDTLNIKELDNFQIDFWINASCPGISLDSNKIINYEDIPNTNF